MFQFEFRIWSNFVGAVPDAAIIVVSGAFGTREEAQDQLVTP
jgi:hypothetical protein